MAKITGTDGNDIRNGTADNDELRGLGGSDMLFGGDGDDLLDGGAGADYMNGGKGSDTYVVDDANDVVDETDVLGADQGGVDLVNASVSVNLVAFGHFNGLIENVTLTGKDNIEAIGNYLDNILTGNDGDNGLFGGYGNDTLFGGKGDDYLSGGDGADTMKGGAGNDYYDLDNPGDVVDETDGAGHDSGGNDAVAVTFSFSLADTAHVIGQIENLLLRGSDNVDGTGNDLDNVLIGNSGSNTLDGGKGNDRLDGAGGHDTLKGGDGDDTYVVRDHEDTIDETGHDGKDTVESSVSFDLSDATHVLGGVENLVLTGAGDKDGTGNALDNEITGTEGVNQLYGGDGNDTLYGGDGADSLNGGTGDDTLYGGAHDDLLGGGAGADVLDGGLGADYMLGGDGDDTYVVNHPGDVVNEEGSDGIDTVKANFSYSLKADQVHVFGDVENLILTGVGDMSGTGNDLNNTITGNAGKNTLDGGDGGDTLIGGGDDDTLIGGSGDDMLDGGTGDDVLDGGYDHDVLKGGVGNDLLDGGNGTDDMDGGLGDDTYVVDDAKDTVTETTAGASGGADTVKSSLDSYTLGTNVENLVLTGNAHEGIGNELDNRITGDDNGNRLEGGDGNDWLGGGAGDDMMYGGDGDDTYVVNSAYDVVDEQGGSGTDTVRAGVTYSLGADNTNLHGDVENLTLTGTDDIDGTGNDLNNTLTGNEGNNTLGGGGGDDKLYGGQGDDTLHGGDDHDKLDGGDGDDVLDGGAGADDMDGGTGNDTYVVDDPHDVVTEGSGTNSGTDTVESSVTFKLGANVENLTLTGHDKIDGTGNDGNNTITGNDKDNILDGGAGADEMHGGKGDDTYIVDNANDKVVEADGDGTDTVLTGRDYYKLGDNVENLTLTGKGNSTGIGNERDNTLVGNDGNNVLDGGAGGDTMKGGKGNDTYYVDSDKDVVDETGGDGIDTVMTSVDGYGIGTGIENLVLTGKDNISGFGNSHVNTLTGNDGNNSLTAGAGNDTLYGGKGADSLYGGEGDDRMYGGAGDDTYYVDSAKDVVDETGGDGIDTVKASINYILGAGIEDLVLTGAALIGTGNELGNALNNTLYGGKGNDTLDGGAGNDHMYGGRGDDTYYIDSLKDVADESGGDGIDTIITKISVTLGKDIENLVLTGAANLDGTGNYLNNSLLGNDGNNTLRGGDGNDRLTGGLGDDRMYGGAGDDTYYVDSTKDIVDETDGRKQDAGGHDAVYSSIGYTLGSYLEDLYLTGKDNIDGTGNSLSNILTGNAGNNTLYGGKGDDLLNGRGGADHLFGGKGNDTYIVDNAGDVVDETGGDGVDLVWSTVDYTLVDGVENLSLNGTNAINGTGNSLNNILTGNDATNTLYGGDGNDTLNGGAGADILYGGKGDDTYVVDDVNDTVDETDGGVTDLGGVDTVVSWISFSLADTVHVKGLVENLGLTGTANINGTGNDGNNVLVGNAGNNTLSGGLGNDRLYGGLGNDILTGGDGADSFVFARKLDAKANVDHITDFGAGIDRIELRQKIFTALTAGALPKTAFLSNATGHATHATDRIIYNSKTGQLFYDDDGNGSHAAVLFAVLDTKIALHASDFLVF